MKNLPLIIFLIFVLVVSNLGQTPSNKNIKQKYDKANNTTTVAASINIDGSPYLSEGTTVTLLSSFDGEKPTLNRSISIMGFISNYPEKKYSRATQLIITIDDEINRVDNSSYRYELNNPGYFEVMQYALPKAIFQKITKAKEIEIKLGDMRYTFTESELSILRDYYVRLNP